MRFVVVAPWRIDSRGPYAQAISFLQDRIDRAPGDSLQFVMPQSALSEERAAGDFLVKECTRLRAEGFTLFCLDENGRAEGSAELARRVEGVFGQGARGVAFVLGGAYGLPAALAALPLVQALSLSPLTFAHELALTVLLEQIYRTQCILTRHPYHHGESSAFDKASRRALKMQARSK